MSRPNITDIPVNKQTAIVVSPCKKEGFIFKRVPCVSSMAPLPMRKFPGPSKDDLTGKTIGRLLVVGFSVLERKRKDCSSGRWVVRCLCGRYEIRTSKSIKGLHKHPSKNYCCHECDRTIETRKGKKTPNPAENE